MEQTHGNIIISGLSLCLRILLSDIKFINGFLSILFFSLQSLGNWVSRNWKSCGTKKPRSYSSPEPQNHNLNLNFIQHGVRLCKEEVIVVMQKLGMSVERDGDGIEDFGEQEITQMYVDVFDCCCSNALDRLSKLCMFIVVVVQMYADVYF